MYAALSQANVSTDEKLQTGYTGVESLLNSRPLTTVSGDVNDGPVLSPNHFLIDQMGGKLPPETADTKAIAVRKWWRWVLELILKVWNRLMRKYLPTLNRIPSQMVSTNR